MVPSTSVVFSAILRLTFIVLAFELCSSDNVFGHQDASLSEPDPIKNPFTNGGCLFQKKANWTKVRVCGSDDTQETIDAGYCRKDEVFDYMEIRINSQNWDAVAYETWILQIVLSEILGVPTSIELSRPWGMSRLDFYDRDLRFDYGQNQDWDCLITATEVGDCRDIKSDKEEDYVSCCHFVPEIWVSEQSVYRGLERDGTIEPVVAMGIIGEEHWFIPKFTAEREPSLLGYVGMSGEKNRRKLADTFLRPVTWKQYCSEVSISNCANDTAASRPPNEDDETDAANMDRFFVPGIYEGHFRKTEENDCDKFPTNCTGHIFNYPCTWSSYVLPQTHYLNISLKGSGDLGNGGYTYGQLVDGMKAANATKSNIAVYWWTPEALYQDFIGTDMELLRVTLPPPTQECMDNRIPTEAMCSPDFEERVGDELGACGETSNPIYKGISTAVERMSFDESVPPALHSPAFEVLSAFQITTAEVGLLFDYASDYDDPRDAVCSWVIDNFDLIENFLPRSYPRVVEETERNLGEPLTIFALTVAALSILAVGIAMTGTYRFRRNPAMIYAQIEFLCILLIGLGLVSVGSLLQALPPSDSLCIVGAWMTNVGYSFELVPLIVKMASIAKLMSAAERMQRIVLTRRQLFGAVFGICFLMVVFMIIWTALDPLQRKAEYELTARVTDNEETIVEYTYYCGSESEGWRYISVGCHMLLLVIATLQAFVTRNIRKEINESQTLAIMIYSHFVFVCLRLITLFLEESLSRPAMMNVRSIIYSLDCLATVCIYFLPKFFSGENKKITYRTSQTGESKSVGELRRAAAESGHSYARSRMSMSDRDDAYSLKDSTHDYSSRVDKPDWAGRAG